MKVYKSLSLSLSQFIHALCTCISFCGPDCVFSFTIPPGEWISFKEREITQPRRIQLHVTQFMCVCYRNTCTDLLTVTKNTWWITYNSEGFFLYFWIFNENWYFVNVQSEKKNVGIILPWCFRSILEIYEIIGYLNLERSETRKDKSKA